jgi:hypothetical protein
MFYITLKNSKICVVFWTFGSQMLCKDRLVWLTNPDWFFIGIEYNLPQ